MWPLVVRVSRCDHMLPQPIRKPTLRSSHNSQAPTCEADGEAGVLSHLKKLVEQQDVRGSLIAEDQAKAGGVLRVPQNRLDHLVARGDARTARNQRKALCGTLHSTLDEPAAPVTPWSQAER